MANEYTIDEVARHNEENDLWMIIHDEVYDLTSFLKQHPGGDEVLIEMAGKDGTECFDEIGHTKEAIELKKNYKIGVVSKKETAIASTSSQAKARLTVDNDDDWEYEEAKKEKSAALPAVIALGVLIYAILFYYYFF